MKTNLLNGVPVGLAHLRQRIGWAGVCGIGLLAAATLIGCTAWSSRQSFLVARSANARAPVLLARPVRPVAEVSPELPSASEVPLLLTQMKQAAVNNGLDWRAAEYRLSEATPSQPASIEVRCSIRGSYPKLRSMLVEMKDAIPAFAIRQFSANRASPETRDIEAKLALAVFLRDGAVPLVASGSSAPQKAPR
jgi:hypothetical protein